MSFRNVNPAKVATIKHINNLITCLVNIKDEDGTFLMTIPDGRIIDTKGWEDWEVSMPSPRPVPEYVHSPKLVIRSGRTESVRHHIRLCHEDRSNITPLGLYGLLKFHEITGDKRSLDIALAWFKDRFEIGTTKVGSMSLNRPCASS